MATDFSELLTPERGLIFRIVHCDNLGWILARGLNCAASPAQDPNFVAIGNPDLIDKRQTQVVHIPPGGTLSDYVPFYFTPSSVMLMNITSGWNGIRQRQGSEIAFVISSLPQLARCGVKFLFTDRHASVATARFLDQLDELAQIDWSILQRRDFRGDPDDPGKRERYQAEALAHRSLPTAAMLGLACYDAEVASRVKGLVTRQGLTLPVAVRREWYFR